MKKKHVVRIYDKSVRSTYSVTDKKLFEEYEFDNKRKMLSFMSELDLVNDNRKKEFYTKECS
ncbi:hypothetical protein NX86_03885 [Streptococcus phocae subsp. salmonis]|nr:hypothetical protein NX86_03885 [Streptococcus phocae subsp. salmonis]